jgi:hypothetical protein
VTALLFTGSKDAAPLGFGQAASGVVFPLLAGIKDIILSLLNNSKL